MPVEFTEVGELPRDPKKPSSGKVAFEEVGTVADAEEQSKLSMAGQAALSSVSPLAGQVAKYADTGDVADVKRLGEGRELPWIGAAAKYVRETLPGQIAETGGKIGLETPAALLGTGVSMLGEAIPRTEGELALGMGAGPAMKGLGLAAKSVRPTILGKMAGIPIEAVKRVLERPIASRSMADNEAMEGVMRTATEAMNSARADIGERLGAIKKGVYARFPNARVKTSDLAHGLEEQLRSAGYAVPKSGEEVAYAAAFDTTRERGQKKVSADVLQVLKDLRAGHEANLEQAMSMKSYIDDNVNYAAKEAMKVSSVEEGILKGVNKDLKKRIYVVSPRLGRAMNYASESFKAHKELSKIFGGNASPEAKERRILNLFKKGSAERRLLERADRLGGEAAGAMDKVLDAFAAEYYKPVLRRGVGQAATTAGAGAYGLEALTGKNFASPEALAGAAVAAAATSPRLQGMAIRAGHAANAPLPGLSGLDPLAELAKLLAQYGVGQGTARALE